MRTESEVKKWLKVHHLFGRVLNYNKVESIRAGYGTIEYIDSEIIQSSFSWAYSPEGHRYWSIRNSEFKQWYYENERRD